MMKINGSRIIYDQCADRWFYDLLGMMISGCGEDGKLEFTTYESISDSLEKNGYRRLTEEEYDRLKEMISNLKTYRCTLKTERGKTFNTIFHCEDEESLLKLIEWFKQVRFSDVQWQGDRFKQDVIVECHPFKGVEPQYKWSSAEGCAEWKTEVDARRY